MRINLNQMQTEQRNPRTMDLDRCSTLEIVKKINYEDSLCAAAVAAQSEAIAHAIDAISLRMHEGGRLIYIGAGTSGRLGVLDAAECPPTYGVDDTLVIGLIAGGKDAMFKAKEGAEDSEALCMDDLKNIHLCHQDSVVGIAASGRTPYVIGGLRYARSIGALTVSISCVSNSKTGKEADINIEAITGPEAITGSTRMKAGTAEKMICNMISTGCMIRYGKVYENLMIDVMPTNQKLVERAKHIISEASGCTYQEAQQLLTKSNMNVKIAILMGICKCSAQEASSILQSCDGNVHAAIEANLKQE